jgi:hypothetical protein
MEAHRKKPNFFQKISSAPSSIVYVDGNEITIGEEGGSERYIAHLGAPSPRAPDAACSGSVIVMH